MASTSIYKRVFVPYSIALLLATGSAYLIATYLLTQTLETRLRTQIEHALQLLAAGNFPLTLDLLRQVSALQETDFVLLDESGKVALSTLAADDQLNVQAQTTQHNARAKTHVERLNGYVLMATDIPPERSQLYHTLIAITSSEHVTEASRDIALTLAAVTLLTLLVLAIWGHRVSRSLTRPIESLVDMANGIAAGHRDTSPVTTDIRELTDLSDALSIMSEALTKFEAQLAQTHRLKGLGELAAQVAHEIRNPLTAIKLQLQLLTESPTQSYQAAAIQPILEEIQRLELIVNSTLSLARPITLNRQPQDLNQTVTDVASLMAPQLAHRNITLNFTSNRLDPVNIDPDRVKQVIFNLLNNAANALPEGGEIRISTSDAIEAVHIAVEDSGPGVNAAEEDRLFNQSQSSGDGLGIGLAICKEIMDLHNGDIRYSSSETLGGACFTITFRKGR